MAKINNIGIYNKISNGIKNVSLTKPESITDEIKKLISIIELAKTKDGYYRFGPKHKDDIIEALNIFKTKINKTEIIDTLIRIGENNSQQLSAEEIIKTLKAITNFKPKEQKNLLKFLKYTIENNFSNQAQKMRERYSFEQFTKIINPNNNKYTIEELKSIYNEIIQNRISIRNFSQTTKPQDHIFNNNKEVIYSIARAKDVEIFAELLDEIGPTKTLIKIPNEIIKILKFSDGNYNFAYDMAKYFESKEVKIILDLINTYPQIKEILPSYKRCYSTCYKTMEDRKNSIITKIRLDNFIKFNPPPKESYSDAMYHCLPGNFGSKK